MRIAVTAAAVGFSIIGLASATDARARVREATSIPAQSLDKALHTLAKDRGFHIVYLPEVVNALRTQGATGVFTQDEALTQLLNGTGLSFRYLDEDTVTIIPLVMPESSAPRPTSSAIESRSSFWSRFRLAQATGGAEAAGDPAPPSATESQSEPGALTEIVVTANRRAQRSQDVGAALQVFSGADLERQGASGFQDYVLSVPGVSFRDQGAGATRISLRGISNFAGSDNGITAPVSTVGLYLNDISIADTSNVPDLALYDLDRIEVLKGPQGTLYGEGSMGGAIRMVLKRPDPERFEARAETTLSDTQGGGFNYQVRGVANIPIVADRSALRFAASYENDEGFIDNLATGENNYNGATAYSVRGSFFTRVGEHFTAEILALHNQHDQDAFNQIDSTLGDLQISSREPLFNDTRNDVFGLTLTYDLPFAQLSSISSYYSAKREQVIRAPVLATPVFGAFGTVTQDPVSFALDLHSVSQELRLVSSGDRRLDWVAGVYYRDKEQDGLADLYIAPGDLPSVNAGLAGAGLPLLPPSGTYIAGDTTDGYEQYAIYGEATYELFEGFDITAGLRWFDEKLSFDNINIGYSLLAAATADDHLRFSESGFVPKYGMSYRLSRDHNLYAQAAKGFRSGLTNINRSFGVGGIAAKSDDLWNYEVGSKNTFVGGRVRLNASVFYVDWKDVQTIQVEQSPVSGSPIGFFGNGGDAELIGAELETTVAPSDKLLLGATFAYTHSELVRAQADAIQGAVLPNVPKRTASGFVELWQPVSANTRGFARLEVQYSDDQPTRPITLTSDGAYIDSYTLGKLQLGLEGDRWGVSLFVDNLWNERAQFGRGVTGAGPIFNLERYTITRPRTYAVRLSKSF